MLVTAKVRVALAGLVVAGGALAAAALGPAGLAVGQASPPTQTQIQVNSPATLVTGVGADVAVTANCAGGKSVSANVSVILTERIGKAAAVGSGGTSIFCTGVAQSFDVVVTPAMGSDAFKQGSAIADGTIMVCTNSVPSSCASQQVEPTIKITK